MIYNLEISAKLFVNLSKLTETRVNCQKTGHLYYFLHLAFGLNHLRRYSLDIQLLVFMYVNKIFNNKCLSTEIVT